MRFSHGVRLAVLGLVALFAATVASPSPSHAATGTVQLSFAKGGWFIGGQAGGGTLHFHGRDYRLVIGGVSFGLTFGGSVTQVGGTARNLHRASDIAGVYTAMQAGAAVLAGGRVITLVNPNGVVLQLRGRTAGLALDLDLSGMTIALQQ
jgi:hypothetical protein